MYTLDELQRSKSVFMTHLKSDQVSYNSTSTLRGAILSAGLGTRLRPLTDDYPKPLIPVAGRPLIEWGLIALAEAGVHEIGVNTHYLGTQLVDYLTPHRLETLTHEVRSAPLSVHWSPEDILLGTGGGLKALYREIFTPDPYAQDLEVQGDLISLNGDALFDFSLKPLIEAHQARGGAISTLALREVPPGDPFGRVGVDARGRVVRIAEVEGPRSHEEVRVGAFTGAQVMSAEVIRRLSPDFSDIFRTAHRDLLAEDLEIRAHFVPRDSLWVDVGNLERYLAAHRALIERPESPLWRFVPPHERHGKSVKFSDALLDDHVTLADHVWVGAQAQVTSDHPITISESVIWRGVEVTLDHISDFASQRVFTPHHALHHR